MGQWNGALLLLVDEPSLFPTVGFCLGRLCIVAAFQLCIPANARHLCLRSMPLDVRAVMDRVFHALVENGDHRTATGFPFNLLFPQLRDRFVIFVKLFGFFLCLGFEREMF